MAVPDPCLIPSAEYPTVLFLYLFLGNIDDADANVGASLGDHSHGGTTDIASSHAADVVLELRFTHGAE